jgi:hypothetical protein
MARKRIQKSKTLKKRGGVWYPYLNPVNDIIKIGEKKQVTPTDLEKVKDIIKNVSQKDRIFEKLYEYIQSSNVDFDNGIKLFLYSESAQIYVYSSCEYDISDIIKIGNKKYDEVTKIDEELIEFFIEKGKTPASFLQNWRYEPGPIVPALDSPPANNAPNDASVFQNWQYDPGHRVTDFPILTREENYSGCVRSGIENEFREFNDTVKSLLTDTSLIVYKPKSQSHQYTPQPLQQPSQQPPLHQSNTSMPYKAQPSRSLENLKDLGRRIKETGDQNAARAEEGEEERGEDDDQEGDDDHEERGGGKSRKRQISRTLKTRKSNSKALRKRASRKRASRKRVSRKRVSRKRMARK